MVLSIVLLSADKKPLLKSALNVFLKLASETRREFVPVVSKMLGEKLPSLLPPMFYIVLKISNGEIEDDNDSKSTVLMQVSQVMLEISRNFHPMFVNGVGGAMQQMLGGGQVNVPEVAGKWVHRFADCKDTLSIRIAIVEFIKGFFS